MNNESCHSDRSGGICLVVNYRCFDYAQHDISNLEF